MAPHKSPTVKKLSSKVKTNVKNTDAARRRITDRRGKIRKVPPFPKYCDEIERDREGNPKYDVQTFFKFTARGEEANRKRLEIWSKCHPPFIKIPRQYISSSRYNPPYGFPFLLWGIPFSHEQALNYAARHRLENFSKKALPSWVVIHLARHYIGIEFDFAFPLSLNHDYLFVFYDNRSMHTSDLSKKRENDIVEVVKRELRSNFEPMWWWDSEPSRNQIHQIAPCQMDLFPNHVYKEKDF